MKNKALYLLLFFSCYFYCFNSNAQAPDTNQIVKEMSMIWPMHFRNMDSAIMVTEKCYRLSRLTPNRNLFMRSLHMMGVIEQEAGNYKNSIQYLDSAITLAEEFNDQKRLGQLYNSIGISYNKLNKTKAGMKCILQSAKIKEEIGDRTG